MVAVVRKEGRRRSGEDEGEEWGQRKREGVERRGEGRGREEGEEWRGRKEGDGVDVVGAGAGVVVHVDDFAASMHRKKKRDRGGGGRGGRGEVVGCAGGKDCSGNNNHLFRWLRPSLEGGATGARVSIFSRRSRALAVR
ncbi:unnamed protein product [Calypogeia fissa]